MLLNRPDTVLLITLDELQLQWVLWLGEGDRQRGVRRAINFVESCAFNYPTHPELFQSSPSTMTGCDEDDSD